jgi:glutamate synthase domain-containing protein 2
MSTLKGRKMLYPRDFGTVTAGSSNTNHIGVSYNNLRIQGYNYGAHGIESNNADDCIFPNVSVETSFGKNVITKSRAPIMTGALGSTFIAAKYWESFAVGAAIVGFPIVIGENVVGVDKNSVIENGRIKVAPELDRRIDVYLRYFDGYGAIIVQMNVEDTRNGVAEYIIDKYGDKAIIELKWGQGAKDIGGEIQVTSLEYATFLKNRGYIVDPDPTKPEVQAAFNNGAIKSFARHSRLGYTNRDSYLEVQKDFADSVAYLRQLGFKRITLKTGSYGMEALAMAIKFATDAKLDLLTIDGSGGGTGMSPWNMMETWGVPSINLHSKAYEYASILAAKGEDVVDLAFAGGIAREDQIFKALALGAPFTKLICMGRALMIPGFLGANIEGALYPDRREKLNGNWDALPPSVTENATATPEELFAGYFDVEKKLGKDEMKNIPLGAIGVWTLSDKLVAGLQQLMAGARRFTISDISRGDLFAANRETARETGIRYLTEVGDETAKKILDL